MDLLINNTSIVPKCVSDLKIYQERFLGKDKFFMVSEQREKYLKLSRMQYEFYKQITVFMDGKHTEQDLDEKLHVMTAGKMNAEQLINTMYRSNLLEKQYEEPNSKVELELSSTKVCEIPLKAFQEKNSKAIKAFDIAINSIAILTIFYALYLMVFNVDLIAEVIKETRVFSWKEVAPFDFLLIVFLGFISVPIHELGHLLAAHRCGIGWKSFTFSMKWGINPVYYIKYYNFYANNSVKKIKVLISGIYFNFIQACLYFILLVHFLDWRMAVLSIINLGCVVSCMMPSGTSDGYHLVSLLLGVEGIRWKMIELVSCLIKEPRMVLKKLRQKENIVLLMYFLVSYGIGIYGCYALLFSLIDYLHIFSFDKTIIVVMLSAFVLLSVIYNFIQFIRKLKKM